MHARRDKQRTRPRDGRPVWAFGIRAGYWPCLGALFVKVDCGPIFAEFVIGHRRPPWWE